jgi:hypothetical protein
MDSSGGWRMNRSGGAPRRWRKRCVATAGSAAGVSGDSRPHTQTNAQDIPSSPRRHVRTSSPCRWLATGISTIRGTHRTSPLATQPGTSSGPRVVAGPRRRALASHAQGDAPYASRPLPISDLPNLSAAPPACPLLPDFTASPRPHRLSPTSAPSVPSPHQHTHTMGISGGDVVDIDSVALGEIVVDGFARSPDSLTGAWRPAARRRSWSSRGTRSPSLLVPSGRGGRPPLRPCRSAATDDRLGASLCEPLALEVDDWLSRSMFSVLTI